MENELLWPRSVIRYLCELVEGHRFLWDPQNVDYPKHKLRLKVFGEIAQEIKAQYPAMTTLTADQVRAKFKKLKAYFLREHKKIQSAPSGSAGKAPTKWEYYDCLAFLSPSEELTTEEPSLPMPEFPPEESSIYLVEEASICEGLEETGFETDQISHSTEQAKQVTANDLADALRTFSKKHNPGSLTSSASSSLLTTPSSSSPVLSAAEGQPRCLSSNAMKRKRAKAYDSALEVALQMSAQEPPTPSFSKCAGSMIENIINLVPSHMQYELSFAILNSAQKVYEDFVKKKNL
ncbi:uncharacterized protein LOC123499319 isoform X2 [Portunus trituberculatus]|uniref:uncharacterized protein LOC123499319 isoform X2 n=1 Tax=Portunus trituberculatus TaxID=210409 RepID=UPI001E1CD01D|nr:uncharacterized protein LOC123499319 isoform X2 [Portunus trituberculatus]